MTQPARARWWDDVVSVDTVKLNDWTWLLWGDRVRVLQSDGDRVRVSARGGIGWIDADKLGGEPLLEVYFIDVGQGDGILVVTPKTRTPTIFRWSDPIARSENRQNLVKARGIVPRLGELGGGVTG